MPAHLPAALAQRGGAHALVCFCHGAHAVTRSHATAVLAIQAIQALQADIDGLDSVARLEKLNDQVRHVRLASTYHEANMRLEVSVKPGSHADAVWTEAKELLKEEIEASLHLGPAPRGVIERATRKQQKQQQ